MRWLARRALLWALFANTLPFYSLYPLLFVDNGLSAGQISALFIIWSTVSVLFEIPSGAISDRFSRRGAMAVGGLLQGAGYALWTVVPSFTSFAAGFVLWGIGGALVSGSLEALVYDQLAVTGDTGGYVGILGLITAVEMLAQLPAALAASLLFTLGGYALVGWVSVASCVAAAVVATTLPEAPVPSATRHGHGGRRMSYLATLRTGLGFVRSGRGVPAAVLVLAVLSGLDAVDEYFPLLARDWGVSSALVPLAILVIPVAGGIGAAVAGRVSRCGPGLLAVLLGLAVAAFAMASWARHPAGMVGVAAFYGLYRLARVLADAQLQDLVPSETRATISSTATLVGEVVSLGLYAAWAFGQVTAVLGYVAVGAAVAVWGRWRVSVSTSGTRPALAGRAPGASRSRARRYEG